MVLVCNAPESADELLSGLAGMAFAMPAVGRMRLAAMRGRGSVSMAQLQASGDYATALAAVQSLGKREGDLFA